MHLLHVLSTSRGKGVVGQGEAGESHTNRRAKAARAGLRALDSA